MTVAVVAGVFIALCAAVELVARRARIGPELVRKLAHMSSAALAAALPLVLTFPEIALLGVVFAGVMAVSMRLQVFGAIHGVSRRTYGEVFFPLGIAVLALACPSMPAFAYGVLVLGLGDGLAALFGERFGRRVVPLVRTRKTLWGSGAFMGTCFVVGLLVLAAAGLPLAYAVPAAAAMAIALTPVELFLTYGLDNLLLPTTAGLLVTGL